MRKYPTTAIFKIAGMVAMAGMAAFALLSILKIMIGLLLLGIGIKLVSRSLRNDYRNAQSHFDPGGRHGDMIAINSNYAQHAMPLPNSSYSGIIAIS